MGKIRRDFLRGELRRLALCAAGFGLCLLVLLRCWSGGKERLPLLLAGIGAVLGLAALRAAAQAHAGQRELNDGDILLLEREYAAPHPVCRVWQGEIHLLPGILVCRSGGRLLFLPVDRIERVEERFDRIGLRHEICHGHGADGLHRLFSPPSGGRQGCFRLVCRAVRPENVSILCGAIY